MVLCKVDKKHLDKKLYFVLALSCLLASVIGVNPTAGMTGPEVFEGRAFDEKGELSYTERHKIIYENGRVIRSETIYFDPDDRLIGDMVSEYLWPPQHCSYSFRDMRAKHEDGVKVEGDRLLLYRNKSSERERESAELPKQSNQIVGQGFHHFLLLNMDSVAQGEVFHIKLVMPSRLDQFSFRIRKLKLEGNSLHIRLETDSWFLRLFAPYVDCQYDLKARRLMRYTGISNLEDVSGAHKEVKIHYAY